MKTKVALSIIGAALISLPAAAQTTRPADQAPKTMQQPAAAQPSLYEMKAGQWRATKLTGLAVYNTANERIGDISELIVDRSGKLEAVVIGVGGFLGMGEHHVAVPFDKVKWVNEPVERAVGTTTPPATTGTSAPATNVDRTDRPATTAMDRPAGTAAPASGTTNDRSTTTTRVDPQSGATVTTTDRPAAADRSTATDRPAATTTDRTAALDRPDHAVVAMTKEQLKALPEVRYAR